MRERRLVAAALAVASLGLLGSQPGLQNGWQALTIIDVLLARSVRWRSCSPPR